MSCRMSAHTAKTKHNPEKANSTKNTAKLKQNYPGLIAFCNRTRPGNEVVLF